MVGVLFCLHVDQIVQLNLNFNAETLCERAACIDSQKEKKSLFEGEQNIITLHPQFIS